MRILKAIVVAILISLIFTACKYLSTKSSYKVQDTAIIDTTCTPYFPFDEIEYYSLSDSINHRYWIIEDNENKSASDSLLIKVLRKNHLKSLRDSSFVDELANIGYEKYVMPTSTYLEVSQIFCERIHTNHHEYGCIPVYRDIFVFRRQHTITGIAKVCFSCRLSNIVGTNRNTQHFGQSGDFEKLESILKLLFDR